LEIREREAQMNKIAEKSKKPARRNITISHKRAALPEKTVEEIRPAGGCAHRWVIESPNGETSHGVCRVCGAEKDFPNAAEDGLWERNVPQSRWTGRTEYKPSDSGF
jgi:hypothetical protein